MTLFPALINVSIVAEEDGLTTVATLSFGAPVEVFGVSAGGVDLEDSVAGGTGEVLVTSHGQSVIVKVVASETVYVLPLVVIVVGSGQ